VVRKLPEPKAVAVVTPAASAVIGAAARGSADDVTQPQVPPAPRPASAIIFPLAPERYKVQLTIGQATHDKFRKVQDLLRHVVPNGDPAIIFDRALTVLLHDLERRKFAKVERPRQATSAPSSTRHVPAAVRRAVWDRDDGRCAFFGTNGRCSERGFLEFHHVVPFARGGPTTAANLQLRCRADNRYEERIEFGPRTVRESSTTYELGPDRVAVSAALSGWVNRVFCAPPLFARSHRRHCSTRDRSCRSRGW
jgi:5-methylcytosine-specific restriction endonuclease McrA